MSNPIFSSQYPSDSTIIRRNLDLRGSSILVIERANPEHIMIPEGYVRMENLPAHGTSNRNRILCSTFGNDLEKAEYDINDIEIYRSE